MKICKDCDKKLDLDMFYKHKTTPDGLRSNCKDCLKTASKKMYQKNPDRKKETNKQWHRNNKDYHNALNSEWKQNNPEKYQEITLSWYEDNKEIKLAKNKDHYHNNKYLYRARDQKRNCLKINATLSGHDQELKEIYKNCPQNYHVDHIIPLNNPIVCGLHVPWNLQYLTATDNIKKSNKLMQEQ